MIQSKTIIKALPDVLKTIDLPVKEKKHQGKVRDFYIINDKRITITTDRQSAFDVILGHIPYKGAVLNSLAAFWFEKTQHIIPNHMIAIPDPNVLISKQCTPIPVEMVVRGYLSGVTTTSVWYSYERGEREIYGLKFPDGMKKNEKLQTPIITPTTHPEAGSDKHDERLTKKEIIDRNIVDKKLYEQMEKAALALFDFGSKWCRKHGLILVDTKYEFGLVNGELTLMDEIHTPDCSRFWIAETYEERIKKGLEPENFDKEFLRLWYTKRGYKGNGKPPKMSDELVIQTAKRYIKTYEMITGTIFPSFSYPIEEKIIKNINIKKNKITYSDVGDNYDTKDPIKIHAQSAALHTGKNLTKHGFDEFTDARGESAYVWKQGKIYMASVIEGLGTKNLIADGFRKTAKKTHYDSIAHDTVATIINDLATVGATPLVLHAYWAIEDNEWLADEERMKDLIDGWKNACDIAGVSWGGGETATMKQIVMPDTCELGGAAIGMIKNKKRLLTDKKLQNNDRILLLKSNGVNANGISLTRAIANKLPKGYATKMADGTYYGDGLLAKSNIYAKLITDLLDKGIQLHYASNITGHGMRKIMRARQNFTYTIDKLFEPQEVFRFIQKHAGLSEYEMYDTYNMGQDYALFLPASDVKKAQQIIKKHKFESLDAGYITKGERKVILTEKNITFEGERLALRI